MTVRELKEIIEANEKRNKGFLDYTVALEQHPDFKQCCNCNKPGDYIENPDGTIFIKSHSQGCMSYWGREKVFGIQIHY